MDNQKPFKTIEEQIKILNNRGLIIDDETEISLRQFGYYSIVNGYKWLFLSRNSVGKIIKPERFIKGSSFFEIRGLYDFDKELRSILYKALLEYESNLKAKVSYIFCKNHPEEKSYLNVKNYRDYKHNSVNKTINNLDNTIKKYSLKDYDNAIKHYLNNYNQVPLWVLVNFLTFGDINYLYRNIDEQVRISIAKEFSKKYKDNYNEDVKIQVESLDSVNHLVNNFRNAVAHGEITYYMHLTKGPSFQNIKKDLNLKNLKISSQRGIFELVISLKLVLTKKCFEELKNSLFNLLDTYNDIFTSVSFASILHDMNFPDNYKTFIK
ncbi:Abi family protein [Apilactobacillus timberlakei]|uniref:Abi family protein n=1 Tax=Apilactobacillus timberlakei TaxID=2008380 RepID=UPI00112CE83E|nr:Abi family protein [Apilactobacillus timberlakei]TPR18883.1 Abi family protein [Apilactobacillus timberlakei]TPR20953.1 Abi family protein [Apilactobacillus timberlakei]TPR23604.1 Abi family protein [Apilactobacillus timberlakei]